MDWALIKHHFAGHFTSGRGCPALLPRLVVGLLYLQHANDASDEMVVNTWLENRTGSSSLARLTCKPSGPSRYSAAVVREIERLLLTHRPAVAPLSVLGQALHYLQGQWPKLVRFVDSGT